MTPSKDCEVPTVGCTKLHRHLVRKKIGISIGYLCILQYAHFLSMYIDKS